MSESFQNESEIYTFITTTKSQILSLCNTIENQLEITLASHFSVVEKDFQLFCSMLYPIDVGLTFGIKTKLFEKLIQQEEPEYLEKNTDFIKSIDRVRRLRNEFAHSMNQPKEKLSKFIGKTYFELDYLELGKLNSKQFMLKDIKERYEDLRNIINELQQFNIRDEKRKNEKIAKIKLKN
ncbi:MAG: hypothetical protein WD717_07270 [Nitrosarchaeum sp.]